MICHHEEAFRPTRDLLLTFPIAPNNAAKSRGVPKCLRGEFLLRVITLQPMSPPAPAIDLRSDTVTKPSPEMRRAMFEAEVGDDVYAEDPTINRLEKRAAEIFGREAALFVPSGTMGNQIAIKLHTHHGEELICEQRSHVFEYEMAMMAHFSGVVPRTVSAENGILTWEQVKSKIRTKSYHGAKTGLVSLENTHNMAGGTITPPDVFDEVCDNAHAAGSARSP